MEFDYSIHETNEYLIIALKGKITRDIKDKWQTCFQEALGYESKIVVVAFKDVHSLDHSMSRDFAIFQQELRKKNKSFFLVGVKNQLKIDLDGRGLIRSHEMKNSIQEIAVKIRVSA